MRQSDEFASQTKSGKLFAALDEVCFGGLSLLFAPLDEGREPLSRLKGFCLVLLGPPLFFAGSLFLVLLVWPLFRAGAWWFEYAGQRVAFGNEEVTIHSRQRGCINRLNWSDIAGMRELFDRPFMRWEILLKTGDVLPLPLVNESEVIAACEAAGVPVKREDRTGGDVRGL